MVNASCRVVDAARVRELRALGDDAHTRFVGAKASLLQVIAEQVACGLWHLDRARSPVTWVASTYNVCNATAQRWVKQAEGLAERPVLASAMEQGSVSIDEADSLLTLTEDDPALVDDWLDRRSKENLSPQTLHYEARRFVASKTVAEKRARYLTIKPSVDENWMDIRGRVDTVEGAEILEALDGLVDHRTRTHRLAEARALALVKLARDVGHAAGTTRPMLTVHVDQDTLISGEGVAVTQMGTFLDATRARVIACDANLEHIIEEKGRPVAVWAGRRTVPPPLRRAIKARDRHCQGPGCGSTDNLEVHHIKPWYQGGRTVEENLLLLCAPCHLNLHRRSCGAARRSPEQPRAGDAHG